METFLIHDIFPFIFGAGGALISEILQDNALEMPKKIDGQLFLGFIGGIIVGGFAGWAVDGSPITSFMGGYAGKNVIKGLLIKKNAKNGSIETN